MQKIKLINVEISELNILKDFLYTFWNWNENALTRINKSDAQLLYSEILLVDVARDLYFNFGTKIINNKKSHGKALTNLTIAVKDAIILIASCSMENSIDNDFEKYVKQKFIAILDEKLKSII